MAPRGVVTVLVCAAVAACSSFGSDTSSSSSSSSSSSGGPGPDGGGALPDGAVLPPAPPPPAGQPLPVLVAHAQPTLRGIATSAKYVYFLSNGNNTAYRVPLDSTNAPLESFRALPHSPFTLAVDGTTVFIADSAPSLVALPEGDVTAAYVPVVYGTYAQYLEFASGALWWSGQDNQVHRASTACTDLGVVTPTLMAPLGLAANATQMWIAASGQSTVARANFSGSSSQNVWTMENDPHAIALASDGVFWTRGSDKLIRGALTGKGPTDLATNAGDARALAADDTWLYWLNEEGMYRIRHDGSDRQRIGDASWGMNGESGLVVRGIAITPTYVFWIDAARGDVWRITR